MAFKKYLKFFQNENSSCKFTKDENEKQPAFKNTNLKIEDSIPAGTYNACIFVNSDGTANIKIEDKETNLE